MERRKALVASAIIAATLTTGAASYALSSGALGGRHDNVGNLQPAPAAASGAISAQNVVDTASPTNVAPAQDAGSGRHRNEHENEVGDDD